jgi:hypothetical protein
MKAPGEAYDNDMFGKDPQPAHMQDFQQLPDTRAGDWGGVHINSGIPNKAFYLVATAIGGHAWEAPGHIWYETLTKYCGPTSDFQAFADATVAVARRLYGLASNQQAAVCAAWSEVGIRVVGTERIRPATAAGRPSPRYTTAEGADTLAALQRQVADLAKVVESLSAKVQPV